MERLYSAIRSQKAAFCCGGAIPILEGNAFAQINSDEASISSPPVTLCWDLPSGNCMRKLTLPRGPPDASSTSMEGTAALAELLQCCAPASFGHKREEVVDESYRKAVKLDNSQFCTTFNPYDCGVIDAITQAILPEIATSEENVALKDHLGVVAQLYKLNIYSAPAGRFRAHVDTPHSPNQFGSLVVCLPHSHQGGQLTVTHAGEVKSWDWSWSGETPATIGWAAFYSDCEHEVHEVLSGYRITLTYNLYVRERQGGLLRRNPVAGPDSYPLFKHVESLLKSPGFLPKGGVLGFNCKHAYAHTNDRSIRRLPYALKGVDVIVYTVFKSFGLVVKVLPVLRRQYDDDCPEGSDEKDGSHENALSHDIDGFHEDDVPNEKDVANDKDGSEDNESSEEDYDIEMDDGSDEDEDSGEDVNAKMIGTRLHELKVTEEGGYDGDGLDEIMQDTWRHQLRRDVHWLNRPGPKELAVVHLTYGNEPGIGWQYSYAAILITVPSFRHRTGGDMAAFPASS